MKAVFSNTKLIVSVSLGFMLFSLILSYVKSDTEWFQASGAVVTIGGVLLAARKIIRLGIKDFIEDESTINGGHSAPTPEEIEAKKQNEKDINSYKSSIYLLIIGTIVWAYGGIILKLCGIGT